MRLRIGDKVHYYKGGDFMIESFARDARTYVDVVVYRNYPMTLNEEIHHQIWVEPYNEFMAELNEDAKLDYECKYKFEKIETDS